MESGSGPDPPEYTPSPIEDIVSDKRWIGVDLDGTLAAYDGWSDASKIGKPIKPMITRVREWIRKGIIVKLFTARANDTENLHHVEAWLKKHGIEMEITATKDKHLIAIWDDRAIPVERNTGYVRLDKSLRKM
jgi:hypothetical protein